VRKRARCKKHFTHTHAGSEADSLLGCNIVHTSRSLNDGGSGGGGRSCGHAEAVLAVLVGAQGPLLLRLRLDVQRRPVPRQPAPACVAAAGARLNTRRDHTVSLMFKSGASRDAAVMRVNPCSRIVLVAPLSLCVYLLGFRYAERNA